MSCPAFIPKQAYKKGLLTWPEQQKKKDIANKKTKIANIFLSNSASY